MQPSLYIPHGGGPCFFMDWPDQPHLWDGMAAMLRDIPRLTPNKPRAILLISAHWEAAEFTFAGGKRPRLEYDYYGFPAHTYELTYPADGAPELAQQACRLLQNAGIAAQIDEQAPWDHGVFIPLKVAYPEADVPVLAMSLKKGLDPAEHIAAGRALASLRADNVLIIASGLSFHNLRTFFSPDPQANQAAQAFDTWLQETVTLTQEAREEALQNWQQAPFARQVHPREEHLLPLMLATGAAGQAKGEVFYQQKIIGKAVSALGFGLGAQE